MCTWVWRSIWSGVSCWSIFGHFDLIVIYLPTPPLKCIYSAASHVLQCSSTYTDDYRMFLPETGLVTGTVTAGGSEPKALLFHF